MIGKLRHLGRAGARRLAAELLERFDLVAAADRRVRTYSGGQRRRLDLAMSLVGDPKVIFLDEPTTGLDTISRTTMWEAIGELVRHGTTIFLTTQYLEEADRLADHIVLLDQGRVVAAGPPELLKSQVGGDRLELTFAAHPALAAAAGLLGGITDPQRHLLSLPSDGSAAQLHQVLDDLRQAGIPVARVTSHRPTLDDAFRVLTAAPGRSKAGVPA
jgi:ABC-2 type transport system ATP-binding protein